MISLLNRLLHLQIISGFTVVVELRSTKRKSNFDDIMTSNWFKGSTNL